LAQPRLGQLDHLAPEVIIRAKQRFAIVAIGAVTGSPGRPDRIDAANWISRLTANPGQPRGTRMSTHSAVLTCIMPQSIT